MPYMNDTQTPVLGSITRSAGVAGQVAYHVQVTYPGEEPFRTTFVGSAYGGPVVAIGPGGTQTFVTDPGRFGEFSPRWVRRFYGVEAP